MSATTVPPYFAPRCASVADQLAFDALPDDIRALVQRLYGDAPVGNGRWFTRAQLEDLYEKAFEDGQESVEIERLSLSRRTMEATINTLSGG